jgi:hypothetical protein
MGFFRKFVGAIRVFEGTLGMPVSRFVLPFFIVLGSSAMSLRRSLVRLGGSSVMFVHALFDCTKLANRKSDEIRSNKASHSPLTGEICPHKD